MTGLAVVTATTLGAGTVLACNTPSHNHKPEIGRASCRERV